LDTLQFNTPIAALMELTNAIGDSGIEPETANEEEIFAVREAITSLVLMLAPFAPHVAEDLYSEITGNEDGFLAAAAGFPEYSEDLAKADEIEVAVQVNGKLRSRIFAPPEASNDVLQGLALDDAKIQELISGKELVKVVVVPGRLVNIVIRG
jgi:leucyl-tRNA synthetase